MLIIPELPSGWPPPPSPPGPGAPTRPPRAVAARRVGLVGAAPFEHVADGIVTVVEVAASSATRLAEEAYRLLVPFAASGHAVARGELLRLGRTGPRSRRGDVRRRRPGRRAPAPGVAANVRLGHRPMTVVSANWRQPWSTARPAGRPRRGDCRVPPGGRGGGRDRGAGAGGVGALGSAGRSARPNRGGAAEGRWRLDVETGAGGPCRPTSSASGTCTPAVARPGAEVSAVELCGGHAVGGTARRSSIRRRCAATGTASRRVTTSSSRPGPPARTGGSGDRPRRGREARRAVRCSPYGRPRRFVDSSERAGRRCARRSPAPSR